MNSKESSEVDRIESVVHELSGSLVAAWTYLNLLRGLHEGARANPLAANRFGLLFDQLWRAIFDALFAKIGTLIDRKRNMHSLPNLVTLIRRLGDPGQKARLVQVESYLSYKEGAIPKIEKWRNNAVAHRPQNLSKDTFSIENKLDLDDLGVTLKKLEDALNNLSENVLALRVDTFSGPETLIEDGRAMFEMLSKGIDAGRQENKGST